MVAVNNLKKGKTKIIGMTIAAALIVAAVFVGAPLFVADAWKSDAIDSTNSTIADINKTNQDISTYSNKLQPEADDYTKLAVACEAQNSAIKAGKDKLKVLGGFAGLDITGVYKKSNDTRSKLIAAYDDIAGINSACIKRANAEKEVTNTLNSVQSLETTEQAKQAAVAIHQAASQVKSFADSSDGTQYDKDFAVALEQLAAGLDKIVAAGESSDVSAMNLGLADVQSAGVKLDDLSNQQSEQNNALQKKSDDAVARLNAAAKELE